MMESRKSLSAICIVPGNRVSTGSAQTASGSRLVDGFRAELINAGQLREVQRGAVQCSLPRAEMLPETRLVGSTAGIGKGFKASRLLGSSGRGDRDAAMMPSSARLGGFEARQIASWEPCREADLTGNSHNRCMA